jgi:hypothetical protein
MLFISKLQLKLFYVLLYGIWIAAGIYTTIHSGFHYGLFVIIFGCALVTVIYFVQKYFIKMIHAENKVLKQKQKHRITKNRGE